MSAYRWAAAKSFVSREVELARLDEWWRSSELEPVNLYGRRRVGKSWLFRRFAQGKPAVILVADRVAAGQQLNAMAEQLEPALGVRPQVPDVAALFTLLFQVAQRRKTLVVVDEFPYLLGTTAPEQQRNLTAIQAVMERMRDSSKLKLILAGSTIAQMESLQAERSPLHGRLVPLSLGPLGFAEARKFMPAGDGLDHVTRYAIAGGMPRYLHALAATNIDKAIAERIVDRYGPLFNEPRTLLQSELREPAVYFSVLSTLAGNPQAVAAIGDRLRMETKEVAKYLGVLESLRLVSRHLPVGAKPDARTTQWRCDDHFVRFWFRFVQPYQAELEAGGDAAAHVQLVVRPQLADHTAPAFEEVLRDWVRAKYAGRASATGSWWGPALHAQRAAKARFSEEIDAVALHGKTVVVAGEAKWTMRPLGATVLTDLLTYKLPAMAQAGFQVDSAEIILASRAGFTIGAQRLAEELPRVRLVHADDIVDAPAPR